MRHQYEPKNAVKIDFFVWNLAKSSHKLLLTVILTDPVETKWEGF